MSDFHTPEAPPGFTIPDGSAGRIYCSSQRLTLASWRQRDVDWTKVRTVEDVVAVLKELRITVTDPSPQADALRAYLAP